MLEKKRLIGLYIDESGKPDAKVNNLDDKYFILTGVLADNVANPLVGYALHKTFYEHDLCFTELHAKALFRGKEGWRPITFEERISFLKDFLSNLRSVIYSTGSFLTVISVVGIKNTASTLTMNDIMKNNIERVFENLLERAALRAIRIHSSLGKRIEIRVLADINEKRREMRESLISALKYGDYLPKYKEIKRGLVSVSRDINFVDSKQNFSVQLADLIGYIIHKYYKSKDGQPIKYFDFNELFNLITPLLDKRDTDNKLEGYGLKEVSIYKKEGS